MDERPRRIGQRSRQSDQRNVADERFNNRALIRGRCEGTHNTRIEAVTDSSGFVRPGQPVVELEPGLRPSLDGVYETGQIDRTAGAQGKRGRVGTGTARGCRLGPGGGYEDESDKSKGKQPDLDRAPRFTERGG